MEQVRVRTQEVQDHVSSGFTVEDSKLLEAVMEHILLHWDDIMACLLDEVLEEEVMELNRVEALKNGIRHTLPSESSQNELIDLLFPRSAYKLSAPHLQFECHREL